MRGCSRLLFLCCPLVLGLDAGITHLWTTPVLRQELVAPSGPNADLLDSMTHVVLRKFRAFSETCVVAGMETDETVNDRFFAKQRNAFERGELSFLEVEGSQSEIEAFQTLRYAWLENAREYLASVSAVAAGDVFDDPEAMRIFVWASVHEGDSAHVPHDHTSSAVSGVFYVAMPENAGITSPEDARCQRIRTAWG